MRETPSGATTSMDESIPEPPPLDIVSLDDDADFGEFITGLLSADGHAVRTVTEPAAFEREIESRLPDIVLLDMNMGVHKGEDVLIRIRERWPKLCVVIVTGFPSMDSMRQTFKQDVFDYLAKPFSNDDLRRVLAQAADAFGLGQRAQDRLRSELGRHIRMARTERGWTLRELSTASAVSVSQLSSIERGTHLPSLESLLAIADALGRLPSAWLGAAGF
ncbi:MAG: response regulator [Planctomycetota bacterium]